MIIKRILLVSLISLVIAGCYKLEKYKKPKNLISKEKMINILIDIRLISSSTGKNQITLDQYNIKSKDFIYKKYNIDSMQFAESNTYYSYDVKVYNEIYDKVKDSLEELRTVYKEIEAQEAEEKKRHDSLELISKKDKLILKPAKDSIQSIKKRDSIKKILKLNREKEGLIQPVSDTTSLNL